jgi:hypothetical protein
MVRWLKFFVSKPDLAWNNDEDQNLARFLKRAATPESMAGTIIHRMIALGLRQLVRCGEYPFLADTKLGFRKSVGLRIYSAYDLALKYDGLTYLIDWKTGIKSGGALLSARRQLAVYGMWAMSRGVQLEKIRVQAFWLQDDEPWEPVLLDSEDVRCAVDQIEEQDAAERAATKPIVNFDGEIVRYGADREAFPTRPEPRRCSWCPYQAICSDARVRLTELSPAGT